MDAKTVKSLVYKAASLLLLAIFLCTSVFIYLQKSFGWFSDNDEVSASGLSIQSGTGANVNVRLARDDNNNAEIESNEFLDENLFPVFDELVPSSTPFVVYVVFKNNESTPVNVTLSMLAPTASDEVPILHNKNHEVVANPADAERFHYFGSQLRLNSVTVKENSLSVAGTKTTFNQYLLETEPLKENSDYQATYVEEAYDFSSLSDLALIADPLTISPGSTVYVALEFQFVDNTTIQNAYINFGKKITISEGVEYTAVCKRTLYCTFEEAN